MALTTSSNRVVATGDNSTTRFYFNRLLYDAAHLQVYLDAALQSSGYTVGGIVDPWTANYVDFAVAPGTGVQVLLLRVVPLTQLSVYGVAGAFPAKTTEKNLDLAVMALQQFDEILDRAITLPIESTLTATDIPDPADPLNYGLGLKIATDGSGLDTFSLSATPFTSPLTTKGDLAVFSTIADRLAVGANGSFLIGASGQARGVKYFVPGTNGYVLQSDSAQTDKLAWVAPNQPGNPIINGNMEIWQRGTTFPASTAYGADRWTIVSAGTGVMTVNRSTNVPTFAQAGVTFNYSLEVDVTTADAAMAAGDRYMLSHFIEGYNWRHFHQRQLVVSFWVMSSKTGVHSLGARDTGDETHVSEFTVNAADTWEFKTVTVAPSLTTGTWNFTNGVGLQLSWVIAAGSFYSTASLSQWTDNNDAFASTNQVNVMDNAANFFRITGVKLELGSVATPLQFVPFEVDLERCKRYFQKSYTYTDAPGTSFGTPTWFGELRYTAIAAGAVAVVMPVYLTTQMRATPTGVVYNPFAGGAQARNTTDSTDLTASSITGGSDSAFVINATGNAGMTVGDILIAHWSVSAEL